MKISSHTLVKNEENFLWFAIKSIINHVSKVYIWDTGSTDNTLQIIKHLKKCYPNKINFQQLGQLTPEDFPKARQKMLDEDDSDWLIILDGDEVWWESPIKQVVNIINSRGDMLDSIVSSYYNPIGDMYHYQEQKAGFYNIDGKIGHHTIRAINRKISGLHIDSPYGLETYLDNKNTKIQDRPKQNRLHLGKSFLHLTHLLRSTQSGVMKRSFKLKYELGNPFPKDFYYPEIFFKPHPKFVPSPWVKRPSSYILKASIQTPLKKIKRRLTFSPKIGY